MTIEWQPSGGVLTPAEVHRALESRPGWRPHGYGLLRALRCRDFDAASDLGDRLADEVDYYGRHPDIAIHDDGSLVLAVAGPSHAGVTVADLRLADMIDRVVAQHAGEGHVRDARR